MKFSSLPSLEHWRRTRTSRPTSMADFRRWWRPEMPNQRVGSTKNRGPPSSTAAEPCTPPKTVGYGSLAPPHHLKPIIPHQRAYECSGEQLWQVPHRPTTCHRPCAAPPAGLVPTVHHGLYRPDYKPLYLFTLVNPGPPLWFGRFRFYEVLEPVYRVAVHPVHVAMDIFHGIFYRKIIPLNPIIPRPWDFYKNTPQLFKIII
jgi:hypothetical protein